MLYKTITDLCRLSQNKHDLSFYILPKLTVLAIGYTTMANGGESLRNR